MSEPWVVVASDPGAPVVVGQQSPAAEVVVVAGSAATTAWGGITGAVTSQSDLIAYIAAAVSSALSSAPAWGDITGIVSDQPDLVTYIATEITLALNGLELPDVSLEFDAIGLLSELHDYDASPPNFLFLANDTGNIYVRLDPTGWSDPIPFRGPPGASEWGALTGSIESQADLVSYIASAISGIDSTTWGSVTGALTAQSDLVTYVAEEIASALSAFDPVVDRPTETDLAAISGATPFAWAVDDLRIFLDTHFPPTPAFNLETFEPYARKDEPVVFEYSATFESGVVLIDRVTGVHFRLVVDDGSLSIEAV